MIHDVAWKRCFINMSVCYYLVRQINDFSDSHFSLFWYLPRCDIFCLRQFFIFYRFLNEDVLSDSSYHLFLKLVILYYCFVTGKEMQEGKTDFRFFSLKNKKHKTGVINDPLGQTQSPASGEHCLRLNFVLIAGFWKMVRDGRTDEQHVWKQWSLPPSGSIWFFTEFKLLLSFYFLYRNFFSLLVAIHLPMKLGKLWTPFNIWLPSSFSTLLTFSSVASP